MRLITWNIQWGRGRDGRVDLRRTADTLYGFDADLICLQEVAVNHPALTQNDDRLAESGHDQVALLTGLFAGFEVAFAAGSDLPDGRGGRRQFGNVVLSRFPLQQIFRHQLPFPPDPGVAGMARSALDVSVSTPTGAMRVITTHLEFYSARQHAAQIEALREIYREGCLQARQPMAALDPDSSFAVVPRGSETVLLGDFNCVIGSAGWQRLQAPFSQVAAGAGLDEVPGSGSAVPPASTLVDAWHAVYGEQPRPPTTGLIPTEYYPHATTVDFAFLSPLLCSRLQRVRVDSLSDASDHQALVIDIADC